jgi:PAS domain S-box-containing protein
VDGDTKRILETNPALQNMLGYTAAELRGMELHEIVAYDRVDVEANVERTLREGTRFIREREYRRKDGSVVEVEIAASAINYGERRVICAAIRDITERKQTEEAIRRFNVELEDRVRRRTAQLQAANEELDALSSSVSHDLRAPLRAMTGFSRILLEDHGDDLDEAGQGYLKRIQDAGERMGVMIDDLLDLSRLSRREMRHEEVDLSALAGAVADDLRRVDPHRRARIAVAEGISVSGDAGLLGVVLENLLENAWKFTSKGPEALIEFGAVEREGRPVYYVRDNGVGFDEAYAERIFDPFQRLHGEDEFEGTGVGLATVARIVRRHGGTLWAEGKVGRGATFYFTL